VIDLTAHVLDVLRSDEEFILYRGRSSDEASRILALAPVQERPSPESIERLEHEYSLKGALDSSWATQPIELTWHWDRPVLLLTDPGGALLSQLLGEPLDLAFCLRLAINLSVGIAQLHGRGVIHKDIKPSNILVDSLTGRCWLTGFGVASRLLREHQSPEPPEVIAGTLAYMAPEQTGRMNRSVDSRSDLYSLGVTLYEMFTGSLPFTASDPMEWVHCHVARQPIPPRERNPNIPRPISAIVMKLLAKNPEERYQTAVGVEHDLRHCLWVVGTGSFSSHPDPLEVPPDAIASFPLGRHDRSDRLLIPKKIYGRGSEIETLLAAFDRLVAGGRTELVLVSGYSGIGKSAIVNELHKRLVPSRGLFAAGKFDQYKRDVPYATLAQAFQNLLRPLLTKSEAELSLWRQRLQEALEPNGQLIVDLVPDLKLVLGEQSPVTELSPQDAQRRFQPVFRRFISVFARPEHPLTLFLDDLQWLDAATLELLEDLVIGVNVQHLMLIGAYRDNEVNSLHPLIRKLETIRLGGGKVQDIVLAPLGNEDLEQLVADSLHCEINRVTPLARLIHDKTAGNPFFAIQFLSELAEDGLLSFDHDVAQWTWDLDRIHAKGYTDNVVDLMVGKLTRLPEETQTALQTMACLGHNAQSATLSIVLGTSQEQVHAALWEAFRQEMIERSEGSYKFIHDRVQEAAYSLIPEHSRAELHLRIGKLLATQMPVEKREEAIFDVVNQLNRGVELISSRDEREQLAELNLIAGQRAKASCAYAAAINYLRAGAALLGDDRWERRHRLAFALEFHWAESEFLTGELTAAAERLTILSLRAANPVDLASVACLRVDLYTTLDQSERAVGVFLEYLRHLGIEWSPHPTTEQAQHEYERIWLQLDDRTIEELIDLPLMSDPTALATIDVLTKAIPPALYTDPNLLSLVICGAVNLSLGYGNTDASCFAYVWFGVIAGPHFGNYKDGFRFGRLGYELVEKRGLRRFQARTYVSFGNLVMPWTKHVRTSRDLLRREFEAATKIGDLTFAAYSRLDLNTNLLAAGDSLVEVQRETEDGLEFTRHMRFGLVSDRITAQLALVRNLRGLTRKFGRFDDEQFDESRFEARLSANPALALTECSYWTRKLQARFFAGDYAAAIDASLRAQRLLWTFPSCFETAEYHFYGGLARAASCHFAAGQGQPHFDALIAHHRQLEVWSENCPDNFENRAALVGAEIARIEGREIDAERLYEKAIHSARTNGFVHNEALANELAARFYFARGFKTIAHTYLKNAWHCYLSWGAAGKIRQLEDLYPELREERTMPGPMSTIGKPVEHLDLATVIKVSQAVTGEMVLEKLIDTLMRTAIEHAGAERGLLIVQRGSEQRIEAEATTSGDTITVRLAAESMSHSVLPKSVIYYVARTHESVILDDASTPNPFSADTYLHQQPGRSVLCLPLVNQAKLIGVLYLENSLAPNVFTPRRISVLKLLASQAAISLENTRLYRDLEEREAKIRRLVDASIVGIFIWNFEGDIVEANEAFLGMIGYDRTDLVSGQLRWTNLTPAEYRDQDNSIVAELRLTGVVRAFQKEYFRKDGSRIPVMIGAATFETSANDGVAFVLDLSGQKRTEEALQRAQTELAHMSRVLTVGELAASIVHEVDQPLTAIVANAGAGLRWLGAESPNLEQTSESIRRIARDGKRAAGVVAQLRALFKKAPMASEVLDINEVIQEVLMLLHGEIQRNRVSLRTQFCNDLPSVTGDKIQLQQVILNLVLNAIQAMNAVSAGQRDLYVTSEKELVGSKGLQRDINEPSSRVGQDRANVLISVRDSGPGLDPQIADRLFDAFYTTKPQGLGMGLTISRSIIEAHGGRLWAKTNAPRGALFAFTLPVPDSPRTD